MRENWEKERRSAREVWDHPISKQAGVETIAGQVRAKFIVDRIKYVTKPE